MANDVCMFNLCGRMTSFRRYIGSLVFTPGAIYFLSTGKILKSTKVGLAQIPGFLQSCNTINNEYNRDIDQFRNTEDYIQLLDRKVLEEKGSVKIEKSEITEMKLPTNNYQMTFKIKTNNTKHVFDIGFVVRNNRLPKLTSYLNTYYYIQKEKIKDFMARCFLIQRHL